MASQNRGTRRNLDDVCVQGVCVCVQKQETALLSLRASRGSAASALIADDVSRCCLKGQRWHLGMLLKMVVGVWFTPSLKVIKAALVDVVR